MIEVIRAGPLTTIQDRGRPGWAHIGVPPSGALDRDALDLALALVGGAPGDAVLETTLRGPVLRTDAPVTFAVTGAEAPVTVDGEPVEHGTAHEAPAGAKVEIATATAGLRSYIAFAGGIDAPAVLGSRSTDLLTGLGPAPLRDGDVLRLGPNAVVGHGSPAIPEIRDRRRPEAPELRVRLGPRDDWFTAGAVDALLSEPWIVSPQSNRTGLRLTGPRLDRSRNAELLSEGIVSGAIQVPPSGEPIVLLADHPTTGGYPVIAVVVTADLPLAAQARPGQEIRFVQA